jgi:hypothetical protein
VCFEPVRGDARLIAVRRGTSHDVRLGRGDITLPPVR